MRRPIVHAAAGRNGFLASLAKSVSGGAAGSAAAAQATATAAASANTALRNRAFLSPAVPPDNVAAPSTYIVAAVAVTPQASGIFVANFQLSVIASAADTASSVLRGRPGPGVVVAGGTLQNGVRYSAGSPVTAVGGGATVTIGGENAVSLPAADLFASFTLAGFFQAPLGGTSSIEVLLNSSGGKNYSSLLLSGGVFELP
jgi:hypothetical protein